MKTFGDPAVIRLQNETVTALNYNKIETDIL